MINIKVDLSKIFIINEIKCIICHNIAFNPRQCMGCDSIICFQCLQSLSSQYKCPIRCSQQKITLIRAKTRFIFDKSFILCSECGYDIKILEYHDHVYVCKNSKSNNSLNEESNYILEKNINTVVCDTLFENNCKLTYNLIFILILSTIILILSLLFAIYSIFFNKNEFRYFCISKDIYSISGLDEVCLISIGIISIGVFSVGIISVGIISIGFGVVAVILCFGLCVISSGFIINSKGSLGLYIYKTQLGVGIIKIRTAICGIHYMYPYVKRKNYIIENLD